MSDDPVIDEVRRARKAISRAFNNDPKLLVEHLIEYQKQFEDRLVSAPAGGPQPEGSEGEAA